MNDSERVYIMWNSIIYENIGEDAVIHMKFHVKSK